MFLRKSTVFVTASFLVFAASPNAYSAIDDAKTSNGEVCTIFGTSKSEKLTGTSKADVICGFGGNDTITGLSGNDILIGGDGNDVLSGGDGNDTIYGGEGDDTLAGQNGNDSLSGNNANDSLDGGTGNDSLQGQSGSDIFTGGSGTDTVTYAEVSDNLTLDIDSKADDGVAGENDNIKTDVENITGGQGNDKITGSSSANFIYGGSGNDMIYGGSGNDMIYGESGNDGLIGNAGVDNLNGGSGRNFCKIDGSDPKYLTCAGNYLELAEKKIEGRITFDVKTSLFRAVVQNKSTYWQNLSYLEMHYTIDGEAKWGMGQGIGWVGPGQTAVVVGGWDPNGDLIPAQPEYGIEAYETFGVFEIISTTSQLMWDSNDESDSDVFAQHEINPGVTLKIGKTSTVVLENSGPKVGQVAFTATNTTTKSGPLTIVLQGLNQKGEVICQGDSLYQGWTHGAPHLKANSQLQGVIQFWDPTCFDRSANLKGYKVAFVSLK